MTITIEPKALSGNVSAISSKSHVHRLLICAGLGTKELFLPCEAVSQDINATIRCLNSLGSDIRIEDGGIRIIPVSRNITDRVLDCGESGSTYRFIAPIVCALSRKARFSLSGKLPERPMDALWAALEEHEAKICGKGTACPVVSGPLIPGRYMIPGDVSSQFISGLLFALPILSGESEIIIEGKIQSLGYIKLTLAVLDDFSIKVFPTEYGFRIPGGQTYRTPDIIKPEGDWSNSALWLCAAAAAGRGITVSGLLPESCQGDRAVCDILRHFGAGISRDGNLVSVFPGHLNGIRIDAADIPDLVPALAVAAAAANGTTVIENVSRLRLKESDRVNSVCDTLKKLGGNAEADDNTILIRGRGFLSGGKVDSFGDHRIVMMAAAASVICKDSVIITGAEVVRKSYPEFFKDFTVLGGCVKEGEKKA
ncbi:MAG: 3-phosphoshikimate 1-carboxyvinyltransferase [Oscillospiraceae bacterium]|nr:3-phosphoshikimate 1-carboxyvinyltransferase [Oscillospiraceae bacterium]